eukprot:1180023-Rhodomonas_salina.2
MGDGRTTNCGRGESKRTCTVKQCPRSERLLADINTCSPSRQRAAGSMQQATARTLFETPNPFGLRVWPQADSELSCGTLFGDRRRSSGRLGFAASSVVEELREPLFRPVESTASNEEVLWIEQIACGYAHSAVMDANGRVFTCGEAASGALGHGTPLQVRPSRCLMYDSDQRLPHPMNERGQST